MNLYLATIKSVMYLMMMDQAMNSFTFPNLNVTDNYFYNIWFYLMKKLPMISVEGFLFLGISMIYSKRVNSQVLIFKKRQPYVSIIRWYANNV